MSMPTLTTGRQDATLGQLGSPRTKEAPVNVNATEEEPIFIGARNEFRVEKLPLTPAEDFLATEQQRARIVKRALDDLLDATNANRVDWSTFDLLRDQIKCRTGINDAAVSLVLFTRLR